jgi:hypothetical protein
LEKHDHVCLKKMISCLNKFSSVNSDNGVNMVKAVRIIIDEEEKRMEDPYEIDDTIEQVIANV